MPQEKIILRSDLSQEPEKLDTYAGNVIGCFLPKDPVFPKGGGDLEKSL